MRQKIVISAMFIALLAAALWPVPVIELWNERMMDSVVKYSADSMTDVAETEETAKMGVNERISLIMGGAVEVQASEYMEAGADSGLALTMEEQIKLLQEFNALPCFELTEMQQMVFGQRIFMHPDDPKISIDVWYVCAEYRNTDVYAYIDAELAVIYDIVVAAHEGMLTYDKNTAPQGFAQYLASFSKNGTADKMPEITCTYGKDRAHLGIISDTYGGRVKVSESASEIIQSDGRYYTKVIQK